MKVIAYCKLRKYFHFAPGESNSHFPDSDDEKNITMRKKR